MDTMPTEQTGRFFTFFFWNNKKLLERRYTIYTHRDKEEWAKMAAWQSLATARKVSLDHVMQEWRITSILIQQSLDGRPVHVA